MRAFGYGTPVKFRMRGNEYREVARRLDVPPQLLAAMYRENEQVVLRRRRQQGPAERRCASRPAPLPHSRCREPFHRREPRLNHQGGPDALFEHDLLALEAMDQFELRPGQPPVTFVSKVAHCRDR